MTDMTASGRRDTLRLAADGCLITGGTFAVMMGAAFVLDWLGVAPLSEPGGSGIDLALSLLSWLLQVGGFVVGPLLAWRLHGRPLNRSALVALFLGFPVSAMLIAPVAMLAPAVDWFVGLFSSVDYAGAVTYLVAIVLVIAAAIVWVDVDALRDLARDRRESIGLDAGRLLATLVILAYWAVVIAKMASGEDALEAGVFLLLGAVHGAGVVTAAHFIGRLFKDRADGRAATSA